MARIRTIKPEFWQDEKLVTLPDVTRLIFLGLVSLADDAGRLLDKPVKIEADLFDGVQDRSRDVRESLANLSRIGVIRRGVTASGQRVIEITNWKRHQRVDHPNLKAAFPEIVEVVEDTNIREPFANDSRAIREPLAHHTNDQRPVPTTNDRGPSSADADVPPLELVAGAAKSRGSARRWPHFSDAHRKAAYDAWTARLGAVDFWELCGVLAPLFRAPDAAGYLPPDALVLGVRDYASMITRGRSAPFASPKDCAKRLAALAKLHLDYPNDPIGRAEQVEIILHGRASA